MSDVYQQGAAATRAPRLRQITFSDVFVALEDGVADFRKAPLFGLVFGGLYAAGGILLLSIVFALGVGYLAYPLVAGSVLIGPFVAAGLYGVSRILETGQQPAWGPVLGLIFEQRKREMSWMAFIAIFGFIIWMYQVRLLLALFLGFASFASLSDFLHVLFTTTDGLLFLAVGHVVGAALALAVFSLSVISFPLLMDRDLDVVTAMVTSVQAVLLSPGPMILWGVIVVALLVLGTMPAFLGLIIVLPVLGHATWHLYRRIVLPPEA